MGVDPPTAGSGDHVEGLAVPAAGPVEVPGDGPREVSDGRDAAARSPAVPGPGLSRRERGVIALGAFIAVFLGGVLLLADRVSIPVKVALALPLVVVGVAAALAVVRPGDGWTAPSPHARRTPPSAQPAPSPPAVQPAPSRPAGVRPAAVRPADRGESTSIRREPVRPASYRLVASPTPSTATPPAGPTGVGAGGLAGVGGPGRGAWYFVPLVPAFLLVGLGLATDSDLYGPLKAVLLASTTVLTAVVVVALLRVRSPRPEPTLPPPPGPPAPAGGPRTTLGPGGGRPRAGFR